MKRKKFLCFYFKLLFLCTTRRRISRTKVGLLEDYANIYMIDPCLYVLRYANKLEFGDKTHEVAMTALRLVQRMKKDSIHSGRHPSGLCGAALLMAARLHDFSRSVINIIQIVNIHESTLKKRLFEFGETLSSTLTPEEFLSVDLEEEQDPPSYKAARLKDKERLHKLMEDEQSGLQLSELQQEIERQLDMRQQKKKKRKKSDSGDNSNNTDRIEEQETNKFVLSSTVGVIEEYLESSTNENNPGNSNTGIGPSMESLGLEPSSNQPQTPASAAPAQEDDDFDLEGLDDDEINSYIMTPTEASKKHSVWLSVNANYLKDLREKEEKLAKAREEGKPEKKKRKYNTKKNKNVAPSNSAGEAIKKMLQEKKISSKINYDVLKSLNVSIENEDKNKTQDSSVKVENSSAVLKSELRTTSNVANKPNEISAAVQKESNVNEQSSVEETEGRVVEDNEIAAELEEYEEEEGDGEVETEGQISLSQMLNQHRDDDEYYGSYDDDDY